MRFSLGIFLMAVAGVAVAFSWQTVPEVLPTEAYPVNQNLMPYEGTLPNWVNAEFEGPVRIPLNGFCGEIYYDNVHSFYRENHLQGWLHRCGWLFDAENLPVELLDIEDFPPPDNDAWNEAHKQLAYREGFRDAHEKLEQLCDEYGEARIKERILEPAPWYHPYGTQLGFTLVYSLAICCYSITRWLAR